jgi:hypothetical protein
MADELKASPTYSGQEFIGRLGQVAEKLGITVAEAMKIVSEQGNSPIKAFLGDLLIADPLKSAGTALQDWTGTPREITPESPYSRLISGKGMTTRIDPRILDVAAFGQPVASRLTGAAKVMAGGARMAGRGAQALAPTANQMLENYMLKTGQMLPVVKHKGSGGNWLNVEEALKNLKPRAPNGVPIEDIVQMHREMTPGVPMTDENLIRGSAINDWIDKKLTRYVKNEMGTPEDPVRLAADAFPATKAQMLADKQKQIDKAVADMEKARAVRNFTPEMMTSSQARIRELQKEKELLELRMGLHFDAPRVEPTRRIDTKRNAFAAKNEGKWGYGQNQIAQNWEDAVDAMINVAPAESFQSLSNRNYMQSNPQLAWIDKLSPDASIYALNRGVTGRGGNDPSIESLGFNHLIDELRNAANPQSGLPSNLLINSKDLPKWTVPQAIEHVDKINAWRGAQKAEADLARASNIATVSHKEYPEQGLRWVELKMPEAAAKEGDIAALAGDDTKRMAALEDAIKYEGEQMNHCVGGYCPDVASGQSRIYSLRDAKGQPHVTIEVEPPSMYPLSGDRLAEQFGDEGRQIFEAYRNAPEFSGGLDKFLKERYPQIAESMTNGPPSIKQIKGKSNKAPKPEHLPFVQDFVRSGQWADVGDIQNANLVRIYPDSDLAAKMKAAGKEPPTYVSQDEFTQLLKEHPMKRGGAVKACDCNDDAIKMALWDKQIQRKANGGSVKKMGIGGAAKAAKAAAKALTSVGKSADELAEVRKVAPEGQQNVQEILKPKSNLKAEPKAGVPSPLLMRSAADRAEEALQKKQAFKSLKGQDRQRAIDSVRAKAERTGIPRTKADLSAATEGEEDIARSILASPAYKIANVVPRSTVNKAMEARQVYRAEPPTTPGANASEKEWADWGASHGVNMTVTTPESLGISDLTSRREAIIPGGLKGTFTIPDLFWIKANNFNPDALPQDVHNELMKKFMRTYKINSPDEVDVFNRLNFALLSPNAPLTQNEFLAQRARIRNPEGLSALAARVNEEGLNRTIANQLGVSQAGSGGMGVLGTADLSNQAILAKLIKDKPSMFQMDPGETMRDVTMRVMNQVPGLGSKTASLGTPWLDLEKANTSAVDLHMIRDAYPRLLRDPIVGEQFRNRMANLLGTNPTPEAILSKPERDVYKAAISVVGGTDMSRLYRLKSGELNKIPDVVSPEKLAYEPKIFSDFNPFYSRVVDYVDESRGPNPEIELFPEQWRKWDVLRKRIEPHEFAHPDYRKLPRQSFNEMHNALTAHKEAGYTSSSNPTMNLSDWRKLYYGRAVPEILAPTAAAGAGAVAAQRLLSDDITKAKGGPVTSKGFLYKKGGKVKKKAEGGLTSDDLILEERKL